MYSFLCRTKIFIITSSILFVLSSIPIIKDFYSNCGPCSGICFAVVRPPCYGNFINKIIIAIFITYIIIFLVYRIYTRSFSIITLVIFLSTTLIFGIVNSYFEWDSIVLRADQFIEKIVTLLQTKKDREFDINKKCIITGCSSQVCSDRPQITTCEYKPEFGCYKAYSQCERQADKLCGWTETPELINCLERAKNTLPIDLDQLKNKKNFNF